MTVALQRNLSVALRPRRFSEMVGNTEVTDQLVNQLSAGRVPIGFLFSGPAGHGKTTLAKILAVSLNCSHGTPGEPCEACITNQADFNIIEVNAANFSKVDDARALLTDRGLEYVPVSGRYNVVILDECQQMTPQAQSVLLLPLESTVVSVVYIFCTTEPEKISTAIKSRLMSFHLNPLADAEIAELIGRAAVSADFDGDLTPLTEALIRNDFRAPRNVVMASEKFFAGMPAEDAVWNDASGKINIKQLFTAAVNGNWDTCRRLLSVIEAAEVESVRIGLSNQFRYALIKSPTGPRAEVLSRFIYELSRHSANSWEKVVLLNATIAAVYRICLLSQEAQAAARKVRDAA